MEDRRILTAGMREEDRDTEPKLRPERLENYIGQENVKENLRVFIEAAKQRGEALDHVLLYGPPGLGKTTLSNICLLYTSLVRTERNRHCLWQFTTTIKEFSATPKQTMWNCRKAISCW